MSADRFTIYRNETGPSLKQVVTLEGEPVVFGVGDSVKLQARLSGTTGPLKINANAAIDDAPNGVVRYDWSAGDTDTAGLLIAWWLLTLSGEAQSSPAVVVPILDHASTDPGVGIYAAVLDVKALGGFLSDAWQESGTVVTEADLATFIVLASSDVDVILASAGIALPLTSLVAVAGLRGLVADGALVLAINATWPNDPPGQALAARTAANDRWMAGLEGLRNGTHSVLDLLEQDAGNIDRSASSLWQAEPQYGLYGWYRGVFIGAIDPDDLNPNLAPQSRRGDVL